MRAGTIKLYHYRRYTVEACCMFLYALICCFSGVFFALRGKRVRLHYSIQGVFRILLIQFKKLAKPFLSCFSLLRVWVGGCKLNFWPGDNPDSRIIDPEKHAEECLARSAKLRAFLDSVPQFRMIVFIEP